jgi:plasmid stability protein
MQQQRRADLVWIGDEIKDFERIRGEAARHRRSMPEEIKDILKGRTSK